MTRNLTFMEFFAGGGMARLGLGGEWRCVLANDMDAQKCASYRANFGDADLIEGDVAALPMEALPRRRADLAWASFPCQDLSLAGARAGMKAKRSGAFFGFWRHMEALGAEGRAPRAIVLENVTGLLTSNGGRDFAVICANLVAQGYRITAMILDAQQFVPQSRPRLFIIGLRNPPMAIAAALPSAPTPGALLNAYEKLPRSAKAQWFWSAYAPQTHRNTVLCDIIDWSAPWRAKRETRALLALMTPMQRARLAAIVKSSMKTGERRAGTAFRRTRMENGKRAQRLEARFDGLAGCLRTPAGGSSRQIIIGVDRGRVKTRLMTGSEAARLMGLPHDYVLPASDTAALKLCGDGVCVPAVRWLAETILAPALAARRPAAAA